MRLLYILLAVVLVLIVWAAFNYWRLTRAAKLLDNDEFAEKIFEGQLIDLRDPAEFHRKHILGARNIPQEQLKMSVNAIRRDKPVLIYENERGSRVAQAAFFLKKQGYKDIYILANGFNDWKGKVKAD